MVKRIGYGLVVLLLVGCGLTDPGYDLSGRWHGEGTFTTVPTIRLELELDLVERDGSITGTGSAYWSSGASYLSTFADVGRGSFTGDKSVNLVVAVGDETGAPPIMFEYDGNVTDDNTISGRLTVQGGSERSTRFVLTR